MINPQADWNRQGYARQGEGAHELEALLWLAAGAAWALVALRAWNQTKKLDERRRIFNVSDRILRQVFPRGLETR